MIAFADKKIRPSGREREERKLYNGKASLRHYIVAFLLTGIAFEIRYFLRSILGDELPFMLFTTAALVTAWYGGAVTGFFSLVLGVLLGEFFFQIPPHALRAIGSVEMFRFLRYVFTGALGIILIDFLRRGERRARAATEEIRLEVERRKRSEAALEVAKDQLRSHATELEHRVDERTKELSASIKSLEGILYHIAHNFRAPVRAMEGFVTLLADGYGQNWDPTAHGYAQRISTSARQLDRLIQDLLDYGRLTHVAIKSTNLALDAAIDQTLAKLAERIKSKKAKVRVDRPLPGIWADSKMLDQILFHLLDNAIKFVDSGILPEIHIWAERHQSVVRLWIQDNGIGIDSRYYERIFRPFERHRVVEGYEGNGVGLAIVEEGVKRLGGRAGVESEPGVGSRFWVEFPAQTSLRLPQSAESPLAMAHGKKETPTTFVAIGASQL